MLSSDSGMSGVVRVYGATPMHPAEISRRLKAGRWLAGAMDDDGKPKSLTTAQLAEHPLLVENGISSNRLQEIEQVKITPPPMELEQIARALGLDRGWFVAERRRLNADAWDQFQQFLVDSGLVPPPSTEGEPSPGDDEDHPEQAEGGGGA